MVLRLIFLSAEEVLSQSEYVSFFLNNVVLSDGQEPPGQVRHVRGCAGHQRFCKPAGDLQCFIMLGLQFGREFRFMHAESVKELLFPQIVVGDQSRCDVKALGVNLPSGDALRESVQGALDYIVFFRQSVY